MPVPETYGLTQQFLKSIITRLEKQLEGKKVEGSSENGAVCVVIGGKLQVLGVKINMRSVKNVSHLEQLVAEAVDDALQKGSELLKTEAGKLMGGVSLY
mgnify:CR=1 FL=1